MNFYGCINKYISKLKTIDGLGTKITSNVDSLHQ